MIGRDEMRCVIYGVIIVGDKILVWLVRLGIPYEENVKFFIIRAECH